MTAAAAGPATPSTLKDDQQMNTRRLLRPYIGGLLAVAALQFVGTTAGLAPLLAVVD